MGFARSNVRTWLTAAGGDLTHGLPLLGNYFDSTTRRKLMQGHPGYRLKAEIIRSDRIPLQPDLLQRATRMDFGNYLPEDILVKVDRASMLNSLEVRAPLLDYRLIEFALGRVPSRLKATMKNKKILLKRLAARVLPPEFDRQRKQGFSIPLASWLRSGPFRDLFWDVLTSPNCMFERRTVLGLLKGQDRCQSNGERLFALVQFELWRSQYKTAL
jgi:asparagine synthase (glutamine-hydrolysing)